MGIDPGLKGGIAVMGQDGSVVHVEKMPVIKADGSSVIDFHTLGRIVKTHKPMFICVEKVHAMPKQGVSSVFTFGMGFGGILGIAAALGVPLVNVRPLAWQKVVLAGLDKDLGKARSILHCKQRYPQIEPAHKHDGIADALCIAEWGLLQGSLYRE